MEDDPEHENDLQPVVIPIAGLADEEGEEWKQEIRVWLCQRHREDTAVLGQIAECETSYRTATGQQRLRFRLGPDVDSGVIAAQLPQVLAMHDASDGSEVWSCSREPPCDDQCLGRGEDAHDDGMGTCDAR